ncbi:hypothetical protein DACRYDRAFT_19963 [Dacryopinax primogenitus]|uniref:Uncharacterized protein n=1 Tax=Dacryopinax primogenitus (strain DJM 731) TaxID=1858805 RepID=M5G5G8_DACPD|nr:uncharacterized protein DACRYDRAFT_19963 [Dacryopinax primogenitus]EJU05501.1 hypothetical protein DACRYDRAFT_19963 [Dacryopinax primogenitus]
MQCFILALSQSMPTQSAGFSAIPLLPIGALLPSCCSPCIHLLYPSPVQAQRSVVSLIIPECGPSIGTALELCARVLVCMRLQPHGAERTTLVLVLARCSKLRAEPRSRVHGVLGNMVGGMVVGRSVQHQASYKKTRLWTALDCALAMSHRNTSFWSCISRSCKAGSCSSGIGVHWDDGIIVERRN